MDLDGADEDEADLLPFSTESSGEEPMAGNALGDDRVRFIL